jgi:arylsulfatase A-like enzyme
MTDQQRFDALGCAGNPVIKTPHLDMLANEGVLFTSAYTSAPSCTPSRAGILTGMSPWHHGMLGYGRVAREYRHEMPRMMRDLGYYTFAIGKMHWSPQQDKAFQDDLALWRGRLAEHFRERGERWVKRGKLRRSRRGPLYSPKYPRDVK